MEINPGQEQENKPLNNEETQPGIAMETAFPLDQLDRKTGCIMLLKEAYTLCHAHPVKIKSRHNQSTQTTRGWCHVIIGHNNRIRPQCLEDKIISYLSTVCSSILDFSSTVSYPFYFLLSRVALAALCQWEVRSPTTWLSRCTKTG